MAVTLERTAPRWISALVLVGLAGIAVALLAYRSFDHRPAAATAATQSTGPAADSRIHVPLFVDPKLVRPTPRFRFTFDPPETLAELRAQEGLDGIVAGAATDLDRAVLLMHWTRRQWEPGVPNPYPPIDARIILRDIRRGFTGGFCAQYNYVLVQALQSLGVPARYVSLVEHEVIEARLPDAGRWICLDPLYDAYYTDGIGNPLSVIEIHRRALSAEIVTPSPGHRIPQIGTQLEAFRSFAVWLKNDHVSSPLNFADLEQYKVYYLDSPPAAAQVPAGALTTTRAEDLYPG